MYYPELAERVHSQRELQPDLYGAIDFDRTPHRFTADPAVRSALPRWAGAREPLLGDDRLVELIRTATMLGDVVADPYAALAGEYGVGELIRMLRRACREGIEAVPDAPTELRAFIAAMEARPEWVDMELVAEGARESRIRMAFMAPLVTRGAFITTFVNTYAALPMALTGALSSERAAHRVNETASFFTVTTLPGALERHGPGFEAAAMVRLMHSMVRCHALVRSEHWDADVYGIPVPQVDQMPAGLLNMYFAAVQAKRAGRSEFNRAERAALEFGRYRCFLLGLPEELLPTDQDGIIRLFHARAAMLRADFDDTTCGELVRSTMSAYLRPGRSPIDRVADAVEKSWSKTFFLAFCGGSRAKAARMGVPVGLGDAALVGLSAPLVLGQLLAVLTANELPGLRKLADAYTLAVINRLLPAYGKPEYVSDSATYRPTVAATSPAQS